MKIYNIQSISLDDGSASVKLSKGKVADDVVQTVYLQVTGNSLTSLAVTGKTQEDGTAQNLAAISMADFTVKSSITTAGIYMLAAEALTSITLTATGECDVVVKGVR